MLIKIPPTVLSIWLKHRSSQPLLAFGGTYWLQITLVGMEVKSCKNFCQMNVYILKRYFCKSVSVNRCMYYWKGWKLIFPTFAAIHTVPSKKSILNNFYQPPQKVNAAGKASMQFMIFFHPAVLIRHHTPHRIVAGRNHLSFAMMGFLQLLSQFFLLFIISGLSENSIYIFNSFGKHHRKLDSIWVLGFKPGNYNIPTRRSPLH